MHLGGLATYCCPFGPHRRATVAGQGWLAGPSGPLRMQDHAIQPASKVNIPPLRGDRRSSTRKLVARWLSFPSAPEGRDGIGENAEQNACRGFPSFPGRQGRCAVWQVCRYFVRARSCTTGRAVNSHAGEAAENRPTKQRAGEEKQREPASMVHRFNDSIRIGEWTSH